MNDLYEFVDLHAHTHFSILDALPTPDDLVRKALELDRPAIALTDHGSVSGHVLLEKSVEGYLQRQVGSDTLRLRTGRMLDIKPIFGVEAYIVPNLERMYAEQQRTKGHITLLAKSPAGYRNILQLVTRSYGEGFYYRPTIDFKMLADHADGVLCLSGCESSLFMRFIEAQDYVNARRYLDVLYSVFEDDFYVELQHFPHAAGKQYEAYNLAQLAGLPHVVTCDVHYLEDADQQTHQMIMAIRDRTEFDNAFCMHFAKPYAPDHLMYGLQATNPLVDWQRAFAHVAEINAKIEAYKLPRAPSVVFPMEGDKLRYIYQTCIRFLEQRELATPEYIERLNHEIVAIGDKGYEDYFLVVADIVNWAKAQGILVGPGRGSAAASVICWGLGITTVDPLRWGLLFERFVDPTRVDLPDIDVDFEDERRSEVFQYIEDKYGQPNVAKISTFMRFGGRQTLHDAARIFGIPYSAIDTVIRYLPDRSSGDQRAELTVQDALAEPEVQRVFAEYPALATAATIQGKIRSTGKHAAGVVVTSEPIANYAAIYKVADSGERLISVDWRDAAYLNLMKIDVLGLTELSIIRMMAEQVGMSLGDIYDIPLDDPAAIAVFNAHDYLGIFQYDGQAVRTVAMRVHFDSLEQIAAVSALARPGPLHAQATEKYIQGRRSGSYDPVITYSEVQPILAPTYGQIVYQETVMRILREIGGLGWQSVCEIRQIMGKSKGSEMVDAYFAEWEAGCRSRNVPDEHIKHIWDTIRLYGKHAFNVAHAVVYGLISYWGAWFKAHHPLEFYWAHLVKSPDKEMDGRIIIEAQRRGVVFRPLDLRTTSATWSIIDGAIAPGWSIVPGVGPTACATLIEHAPYEDIDDIAKRCKRPFERPDGTMSLRVAVNSAARENIADYTTRSIEDIYELAIWEQHPERTQVITVLQTKPWKGYVIGRVTKINKKSRKEEAINKDKPMPPEHEPDEYAVLTLLDDTGTIWCWVDHWLYPHLYETIWGSDNNSGVKDRFVRVKCERSTDIPVVSVQDVELLEVVKESSVLLTA